MKRATKWAALTVVVGFAAFLLAAPYLKTIAEERLRRVAESVAAQALGGSVRVSRARILLIPAGAQLLEIRLSKEGNRGSRAEGTIERIELHAGVLTLLGFRHGPVEVEIDKPRVTAVLAEGRRLSSPGGDEEAGGAFLDRIPAGSSLVLRRGAIEVGLVDGTLVSLHNVKIEARGAPESGSLQGHVEFSEGSIRSPAGEWSGLSGEATFVTKAAGLSLDPLSIRGEGITLSGLAQVGPGDVPSVQGKLQAAVDLEKIARFFPAGAAPAGHLDLDIDGTWDGAGPKVEGRLGSAGLRLWGLPIDSLGCRLRADDGLRIDELRAHLLGGESTGSVNVSWTSQGWRAESDLRLDGLDVAQVLGRAGWSGPAVEGTIHYGGRNTLTAGGIAGLRGSGILDVVGHFVAPSGASLPLEATSRLVVQGAELRLEEGRVRAGSVIGSFSGTVSQGSGLKLRLSGATGNISEILPLFTPAALPKPPPRPAAGAAGGGGGGAVRPVRLMAWADDPPRESSLERLLRGFGGRWRWDGELQYVRGDLTFSGTLAGTDLTLGGVRLGAAEADVVYAGDRLTIRASTVRGEEGGEIHLKGSLDFSGERSLALEGTALGFPIAPLLAAAGSALPIEGALSATLRVGGRIEAPSGRASIESGSLRVMGVPFDSLKGDLEYTPEAIEAHGLVLSQGDGTLRADGRIAIRAAPGGAAAPGGLVLEARDIDLSRWSPVLEGIPLAGAATLKGTLGGTLEAPTGTLSLEAEDVVAAGRPLGAARFEAVLEGTQVTLRGALPRRGIEADGRITRLEPGANGEAGPWSANLRCTLTETRLEGEEIVAGLPRDIGVVLTGRGSAGVRLDRPGDMKAHLVLEGLSLSAAGAVVSAEGPVEIGYEGGRLRLAPAILAGTGTRIDLQGEVATAPGGVLDLEAHGSFDLALLRLVARNLQANGKGEIQLTVGGAREDPSFQGWLQVSAEALHYPDLPFPISNLMGRAVFDGSGAQIEALTFQAGGGVVQGSGSVLLGGTGFRSPFSIRTAEIRLRGEGVKADFPAGFRSLSDIDLTLRADPGGVTLGGRIDLIKGIYSRNFHIESSLVGGSGVRLFDFQTPVGPMVDLGLDLTISAPEDIWLRNDFGNVEGQGELQVKGTAARPAVAGRITAVEGGTVHFRKVNYRVDHGTVDFNDPETINPEFDLSAQTTVGEYEVTLRVEGTIATFRYDLSSTPSLPQADIVALLLTGRTRSGLAPESGTLAEETVSDYLAGQLSQELSDRLSGKVGIDVLAIDPGQVSSAGDPTTRVTLGKQVTPDLFVTYSEDLGGTSGSIYQLDHSLSKNFKLTSVRSSDGAIGADVRYVLRGAPPALPALDEKSPARQRPILRSVRLAGATHFEEAKLRRRLRLRPGRSRDRAAVNDGVERVETLYRDHDYLMAGVSVDEKPAGEGTVDLTVRIVSGPRISIDIEGVRGREGLRQEIASNWQQGIFLDDIAAEARERLAMIFRNRGYLAVDVAMTVEQNDPENFRVRFMVRRGPRVQADAVRVAGASQISEKEVLDVIGSSPDTAFSRGIVRTSKLREDVSAIRALYLSRGFARVVVEEPKVVMDGTGERATVTFNVEEGPRISVRGLRFEGAKAFKPDRLEQLVALPEGVPYTQETAEAAQARVRRAYDDAGYPDSRVHLGLVPVVRDEESEEDDLVFSIDEGAHQIVGRIDIKGNLMTREKVIRKGLTIKPGDAVSRRDLLDSQTRLYRRGIFSSVQVKPGTDSPGESPAPDFSPGEPTVAGGHEGVPVVVAVREAARLTQVFGFGYDTDEHLRGLYEISNHNVLGSGRHLGLQTRASSLVRRASILYRELGVFGGRYDATASAFGGDEQRPAFDVRTIGSAVQITRQVTRATRLQYRYSLQDVDLSDASAEFDGTTLRLAGFTTSAVHDTRDSFFEPSDGHLLGAEASVYGNGTGSEADFTKFSAQAFFFREVLPRTVWAQGVRAGSATAFGRSRREPTLTGDSESGVPPTERFFTGGDTTLRGFERDRVGPIDAEGDPIGGEGLFLLNEELRFPIYRKLRGVLFYDVGNVFRTLGEYSLKDLRHVAGCGLRLTTPIGPFRLEYGAILDREPGEARGQLFLSIGQAF
jgi:outer membrane protein assembly complex protein YaeT